MDMTYRSKSAARAVTELMYLVDWYPGYPVWAVDYILDTKYFKDFIPELASRALGVELFYEVKSSSIRKDQLRMLRDAGVNVLQPGIESFSDRILTMMRKGNRGLQNLQFLKWCKELGVKPFWNIIWGFPGEPAEEDARMTALIPHITHLSRRCTPARSVSSHSARTTISPIGSVSQTLHRTRRIGTFTRSTTRRSPGLP